MAFSLPDIRPLRLVCLLVLIALAAWHLRMSLLLQSEFSDRKVADPEIAYERNPRMLTWHGKERHLIEADTAGAERLFRQALAVNPVFIPAWLGLAELKNDTGDRAAADRLLNRADQLTAEVNRYRWDKVLVAHQMGRRDILERDLVWLAAEATGKTRDDALRLAFSLWPEPAELMRVMGADNLASLFHYAVRSRRVDEAAILWAGLGETAAAQDRKQVADFVELLLRQDRVERPARCGGRCSARSRCCTTAASRTSRSTRPLAGAWARSRAAAGGWRKGRATSRRGPCACSSTTWKTSISAMSARSCRSPAGAPTASRVNGRACR